MVMKKYLKIMKMDLFELGELEMDTRRELENLDLK